MLTQAVELERQNFEAKSAVAVKDTEVHSLREELEAATQVGWGAVGEPFGGVEGRWRMLRIVEVCWEGWEAVGD